MRRWLATLMMGGFLAMAGSEAAMADHRWERGDRGRGYAYGRGDRDDRAYQKYLRDRAKLERKERQAYEKYQRRSGRTRDYDYRDYRRDDRYGRDPYYGYGRDRSYPYWR